MNHPVFFFKWIRPLWLCWLRTQEKWRIYFLLNYAFYLWKNRVKCLWIDAFTVGFWRWMWSIVISLVLISHETKGGKIVFKADVTVAEMKSSECRSDTALLNCLGFYCFNLTDRISVCNAGDGVVWPSCRGFLYTIGAFYNYSNHFTVSSPKAAYFSTWGCMNWVLQSFVKNSFGTENRPYPST